MSAQHTPGLWHVNDDRGARYIETSGDDVIAQVFRDGRGNRDADARLIAAAPELLAVVQELFSLDEPLIRDIYGSEFVNAARAAIAKATGGDA